MSTRPEELNHLLDSNGETVGEDCKGKSKRGKIVMFCCIAVIAIDYSIVMPSIWLFLLSLSENSAEEWMLGLAIGSFSLSSFLLQYPIGVWLDRRPMKEVLVFCLWISMLGNFVYFLSVNVWMVCVARFVCGIGMGLYLIMSVFILRTTKEEGLISLACIIFSHVFSMSERSEQFSYMNAVMMVAMIVSPALNEPLTLVQNMRFAFFEINSLNIVGLVMAGTFGALLILVHLFFQEPPHEVAEKQPLSQLLQVVKIDTGSLLLAQFVALFNQTCIEVIIPPLVVAFFSFGQLLTSVFYAGLTAYLLVCFVLAGQLSKKLSDRTMIFLGWLCVGGGGLFLLLSQIFAETHILLWQLIVGSGIFVTSNAFFETCVPSLFSKMAARHQKHSEAASQSLLVTLQSLAILIAPFAISPILTIGVVWVFLFVLVLWFLAFLFFLFSFRHLAVQTRIETVHLED